VIRTAGLGEPPETLPKCNRHLEFDATEKLGAFGTPDLHTFADIPKIIVFTLNCDQDLSLSHKEGAAFCGHAFHV